MSRPNSNNSRRLRTRRSLLRRGSRGRTRCPRSSWGCSPRPGLTRRPQLSRPSRRGSLGRRCPRSSWGCSPRPGRTGRPQLSRPPRTGSLGRRCPRSSWGCSPRPGGWVPPGYGRSRSGSGHPCTSNRPSQFKWQERTFPHNLSNKKGHSLTIK